MSEATPRFTDQDLFHMFTDFDWITTRPCEFPRCTHHGRSIVEVVRVNNDTEVFQEGDIIHIEAGVDLARDDWTSMVVGADVCRPTEND